MKSFELHFVFYKKPGGGPSSKSFLFSFLSIKVASSESFLNCDQESSAVKMQ